MDPTSALAQLREVAPQLRAAAILGEDGATLVSNAAQPDVFAGAIAELLDVAASLRPGAERSVERVQVVTEAGAIFAVSHDGRTIAAAAPADAAAELVLHDLRRCLAGLDQETADASS